MRWALESFSASFVMIREWGIVTLDCKQTLPGNVERIGTFPQPNSIVLAPCPTYHGETVNLRAYTFGIGCMLIAGRFAGDRLAAAAEPSGQPEPRWIEIGSEKVVIARDSKSPDGRNALAWTVDSSEPIDWSLLEKDADRFYEQYDLKAIWVINLADKKKVGMVGDRGGYVRPGSHRTLSVAWGPVENGRRFALAAYQWKWGTDTLLLLDVGIDDCRSTQIGAVLDKAIEVQIKRAKPRASGPFDSTYLLTGLPELGKKTGFSGPTTVGLPFVTKDREQDAPVSEGFLTLKLVRAGEGPTASVVRLTPGPLPDDPFSESARLAKADRELNAIYSALLKRLKPSEQQTLRTEQRAWVEQRDRQADEAVRNKSNAENERIVRDRVLRQLTEERSAELRKRLEPKQRKNIGTPRPVAFN
jgi:Lysozyme inhibitor LprI